MMPEPDKKCTLYLEHDNTPPDSGTYMVTFFKSGKVQVWLIASIRKISHKMVREDQGYAITAYNRPDLVELTEWDNHNVWVRGELACGCHRLPWKKNQ